MICFWRKTLILMERLSSIGDKFGYDTVILSATGFGAVFSEVIRFASDADEGSIGCLVEAILGELFAIVSHDFRKLKCH